jgi:hypothetical protein
MATFPNLWNIRLATTSALLARGFLVYSWRLPVPSLPVYSNFSERVDTADGGQALRGSPSFSLTWDRLDAYQARTLRKLVEAALDTAGGVIYATIDYGWSGGSAVNSWVDVSGYPLVPQLTLAGNTGGRAYDSVTLVVNNLTVVSNPASGV